jgi:hypothetical protein
MRRFSTGMSLDVNGSFNSALFNSENTFQSSFNDCKTGHCHSLSDIGTLEVLTFSLALIQLLATLWAARCRNIFQSTVRVLAEKSGYLRELSQHHLFCE